jgi:MFS-type transporter involved in bile tolerance (Atg22 family)
LGILSIIILFIVGGVLLTKVDEKAGAQHLEDFRSSMAAQELQKLEK